MAAGVVKIFFCLFVAALAETNESKGQTSTTQAYAPRPFTPESVNFFPEIERTIMSCEDVSKLVEEMDSNYSPTEHERDWIIKCLMPTLLSFKTTPQYSYDWPGFEETTEPANEYTEDFKFTDEVIYPVHEHKPPVHEHNYEEYPTYVGSSRGIAGYNYPNYFDIPQTSFTCMENEIIPGFYADLETGCQVFHVCWPHRRESFLCPVGTIFNQALLACDFWYNSNCSLAPLYYNVNADAYYQVHEESASGTVVGSMIDTLIDKGQHGGSDRPVQTPPRFEGKETAKVEPDLSYIMKLLPIKAKVTVYPESKVQQSKIVAEASIGRKKKISKQVAVTEKPEIPKYEYDSSSKFAQDPAVLKVVGDIFDAAKKIVEESRGRASQLKIEQMKLHKPKHLPLTKLDPRFITKPGLQEHIPEESVKVSNVLPQTEHKGTRVVKRIIYKPAVRASSLKKVSPITRKALAGSYLKLLKLKG